MGGIGALQSMGSVASTSSQVQRISIRRSSKYKDGETAVDASDQLASSPSADGEKMGAVLSAISEGTFICEKCMTPMTPVESLSMKSVASRSPSLSKTRSTCKSRRQVVSETQPGRVTSANPEGVASTVVCFA